MNKFQFIIPVLFIFFIQFLSAQKNNNNFAFVLQEYKHATTLYNKAIQLSLHKNYEEKKEINLNKLSLQEFKKLENVLNESQVYDSLLFFTDLKIGELEHYFDSTDLALQYYKKAVADIHSLPDSLLFKPLLYSGIIYFQQNQWDSATYCFKKAEHIQDKYAIKLQENERLYNALGVLLFQAGNYKQAKNYFRKASEVLPRNHPYFENLLVNYKINFATCLFKLEDYDSAGKVLNELVHYKQHLNEIYNNIGLIQFYSGKPDDAIKSFKKVHYSDKLSIGLNNDIANAWISLKKYDSAFVYINKALNDNNKYNGTLASADHGLTLKVEADLQFKLNHYASSIHLYQLALHQFFPGYNDSSLSMNPIKFKGAFNYIFLFRTLASKAEALSALYMQSKEIRWLKDELSTYETAFSLIDYIERNYDSDEARLFLERSKYTINEKPINAAFDLYHITKDKAYLEKAYMLDQKSKASVLVFNELQNSLGNSPSPLRTKERKLKEEITRLSIQIQDNPTGFSSLNKNREIENLEIQLGKIQEQISENYPLELPAIPSIKFLQKQILDDHTMILSFHLSQHKLSIFNISKKAFEGSQKELYPQFNSDLLSFLNSLKNVTITEGNKGYQDRLFDFILKEELGKKYDRLIIIPDNELNYIPFEAFRNNSRYLIQDYSVQYQYSTVLLRKESFDFSKASIIGFAPFTEKGFVSSDLSFQRLPYSLNEVKIANAKYLAGSEATKQHFLNLINGFDVVHLATHAISKEMKDQYSYIAFAPWNDSSKESYLIYASEIYNLSLRTNKLIILSACETGTGDLIKGEGVMSLSRAFAYSGCSNVITSLWQADDESTAYITQKVHYYLSKGRSIDQSLQNAKLDYLSDPAINPRRKAPAFWAHLIFIGNFQPYNDKNIMIWIVTLIGILFLIILIILNKRT